MITIDKIMNTNSKNKLYLCVKKEEVIVENKS